MAHEAHGWAAHQVWPHRLLGTSASQLLHLDALELTAPQKTLAMAFEALLTHGLPGQVLHHQLAQTLLRTRCKACRNIAGTIYKDI